MKQYVREVDQRFQEFSAAWPVTRDAIQASLTVRARTFKESYRRIASLQAWRAYVLEPTTSPACVAFFLEAQNDCLVSHTLAQMGSWRVALKSLRSCIENVASCLYFKDHSIELEWWSRGEHRLNFAELKTYFLKHPLVVGLPDTVHGLNHLELEYTTLSRAVHASARSFRMTDESQVTMLWKNEAADIGRWQTRERHVLAYVNLLLLCLFRDKLQGAALPEVRKAASLAIPGPTRQLIQRHLHVRLPSLPAGG